MLTVVGLECDGLTPDEASGSLRQRPAEHRMYGLVVPPVFLALPSWVSAAPRDRAPLHAASAPSPAARLPGLPLRCPCVTPLLGLFDSACCPLFLVCLVG